MMQRMDGNNPLRQMVLRGKARENFFAWYYKNFQKKATGIDLWAIGLQLELFSQFFNKPIRNANEFYFALEMYNNA